MFKSEKGITLVALVITIIVLLILAGITLMLALGDNGILGQAQKAKIASIEGEVSESMRLAILSAKSEIMYYTNDSVADNDPDGTGTGARNVGTMVSDALPHKEGSAAIDPTMWEVSYTASTSSANGSGTITYKGSNYKSAIGDSAAQITMTFTYNPVTYTLTSTAPASNITTSALYVAP